MLEVTFKSVCDLIKKQGKDDPKLIECLDHLLGLAIVCSPIALGPTGAAFLPTLAVKNEVVKMGKYVFERASSARGKDYSARHEAMRVAYSLIVFTAFFEALDSRISAALRKEFKLLDPEKTFIAKKALEEASPPSRAAVPSETRVAQFPALSLSFPHPTETLSEQAEHHSKIWKLMAQGFLDFIRKLAVWEEADDKKRSELLAGLEKIDQAAATCFDAQYFELSRKYEDFAIWANLQAHKDAKAILGELSDYVRQHASLSAASASVIDVGFTELRKAVLSMPANADLRQATEIAESFNKHYQARLNEPVIEDKDIGEEGAPRLSFPKVSAAFVPQAFRVLRRAGDSKRLEEESTWRALPRRNDLGAFLLSYLSSPYSTEAPLLILGHPGSGKSLLTTILSAQLMSDHFTVIRIPLREVNADADIPAQIEEYIKRISGISFDSWTKLRSLFRNCPPVVILDGYDELLQASGQVFASYIMEAQRFQQHQSEQGWPVRVIVTSRVTLIDKAAVPTGSTIVRLLEFDQDQRDHWVRIWNASNASYFHEAGIEPFSLPDPKEAGSDKVLNLAEQPLLLLMLALYDSQGNQLKTSKGLDRTTLYDSLLRRFVLRERGKEKSFSDGRPRERDKALSIEMQRLGVAALGMYNRRKVHILSAELDEDLAFFKMEREISPKPGKALSQADLLLGSFFFVHKSKAQHNDFSGDAHEEASAFEFLHNTFGEFLTADFIIRRAVAQVKTLRAAETEEAFGSVLEKMLGTADGFERDWFASLVFTPLFTRPVVMEMAREWAPRILEQHGLTEDEFAESLDKILLNQISRLLSKREMPQIMRKETAQEGYRVPFGDHPLVGHIAIYSINLILLRLVAGAEPLIFDEAEITIHEDGTRPWDRLIHIWRSWFSISNLNGLTAVMVAKREGSQITVSAMRKFKAQEARGPLNELYNVAISLGDNAAASLSGLLLFDPFGDPIDRIDDLEERIYSEQLDLIASAKLAKLLALSQNTEQDPFEFLMYARGALEHICDRGRPDQLRTACLAVAQVIQASSDHAFEIERLFSPRFAAELALKDVASARILFKLWREGGDEEWAYEFSFRAIDAFVHEGRRFDVFGRRPDEMRGWLELFRDLREIGPSLKYPNWRSRRNELVERALHPRRMLSLSEHNPDAFFAYVLILGELHEGRALDEPPVGASIELLERGLESSFLRRLGEHTQEDISAYLRTLRELVGDESFQQVARQQFDIRYIERLLDPSELGDMMDRAPRRALARLQLLRALAEACHFQVGFAQRRCMALLDQVLESHRLLSLSKRSPKVALACLRVARDLRGPRDLPRGHALEIIERLSDPQDLAHLLRHSPDSVLFYLRITRELTGSWGFEHFAGRRLDPELLHLLLSPRRLLQLSEHDPAQAQSYVQLLQELGADTRLPMDPRLHRDVVERALNPRDLLRLAAKNPQGALAYLNFLDAVMGSEALVSIGSRFRRDHEIGRIWKGEKIDDAISRDIQSISAIIKIITTFDLNELHNLLGDAIAEKIDRNGNFQQVFESLPFSAIKGLKRIADQGSSLTLANMAPRMMI